MQLAQDMWPIFCKLASHLSWNDEAFYSNELFVRRPNCCQARWVRVKRQQQGIRIEDDDGIVLVKP